MLQMGPGTVINNYWDEVFVISRIITIEVGVISRNSRLRLITLTQTLIILDIPKTESNNNLFYHTLNAKTWKSCFCFFTDGKQYKSHEVDIITLKKSCTVVIHNTITHDLEYPWYDNCIICCYDVTGADLENSLYSFGHQKRDSEFNRYY